jgi:hypothetical protein
MKVFGKVILAGAVLACAFAAPTIARAADFSGNWSVAGHMSMPGGGWAQVSPVCKFQQSGGAISGYCKGPNGEGPAAGKEFGAKIVWHWDVTATTSLGRSGVVSFSGILGSDGIIRGTWITTAFPGYTGDYTGTPVK